MKKLFISSVLSVLFLSGCNSLPIASDNAKLIEAKAAIKQAKSLNAQNCAPSQLAKAEARLYLAEHEMTEHHETASTILSIIHEAKSFADKAISTCHTEIKPTVSTSNDKITLYFNLGSSELTADSKQLLTNIAEKSIPSAKIQLSGHTDTSGSDTFNQQLSQRRANRVKKFLLKQGVKANMIEISAHGENQLQVPTADGVYEQKNRRVEINFH